MKTDPSKLVERPYPSGKFRKKPVVIDAVKYEPGKGIEDGIEEINGHMMVDGKGIPTPYINTLEGKHYISPGDWIITGVKGERYPIKEDIFEMTYEPVSGSLQDLMGTGEKTGDWEKRLGERMRKPREEYKNSDDPIERLVYFVTYLSPHNIWKGYEAVREEIQKAHQEGFEKAREDGKREMISRVESYFENLIIVPDPQATKQKLLNDLKSTLTKEEDR